RRRRFGRLSRDTNGRTSCGHPSSISGATSRISTCCRCWRQCFHRIYVVENGNDDPIEGTWTFKAKVSDSLKHPLPIAELFGQCDHNALGATEVTESVHLLVLRNFANKFGPVLLQASNDVINVRDGDHDAAYAQRVHRYIRFSADCRWFLKLA